MAYSADLARDVKGRELEAHGVIEILRMITKDETCDILSRIMAYGLACELYAIVKIVDLLTNDPSSSTALLLDGPFIA